MKAIQKTNFSVLLDITENGEITAKDIHGNSVSLRMSHELKKSFDKASNNPPKDHKPGTVMPDNPSNGHKPGTVMPDGTIYAGISPDTGRAFYAAAKDAMTPLRWHNAREFLSYPNEMKLFSWHDAIEYAKTSDKHGHKDWRVPTIGELHCLFKNRAAIGGFSTRDSINAQRYWSSTVPRIYNSSKNCALYNDFGFREPFRYMDKEDRFSVRCVRA